MEGWSRGRVLKGAPLRPGLSGSDPKPRPGSLWSARGGSHAPVGGSMGACHLRQERARASLLFGPGRWRNCSGFRRIFCSDGSHQSRWTEGSTRSPGRNGSLFTDAVAGRRSQCAMFVGGTHAASLVAQAVCEVISRRVALARHLVVAPRPAVGVRRSRRRLLPPPTQLPSRSRGIFFARCGSAFTDLAPDGRQRFSAWCEAHSWCVCV